jgi:hypothetical protein
MGVDPHQKYLFYNMPRLVSKSQIKTNRHNPQGFCPVKMFADLQHTQLYNAVSKAKVSSWSVEVIWLIMSLDTESGGRSPEEDEEDGGTIWEE